MHEYIISGHPLSSYSERLDVLSQALKVKRSFLFARLLFFGAVRKRLFYRFAFLLLFTPFAMTKSDTPRREIQRSGLLLSPVFGDFADPFPALWLLFFVTVVVPDVFAGVGAAACFFSLIVNSAEGSFPSSKKAVIVCFPADSVPRYSGFSFTTTLPDTAV